MKLNYKTKTALWSVIIMMGLLIAISALRLVKANQQGGINLGEGLTAGIIIALALFSIVSVFIIRKVREKREPKLDEAYRNTLEDIMAMIGTANLTPMEKQQIREDLMDLFAEASADGRTVKDVIGRGIDQFAADIIEAHGARNNFWTYLLSGTQFYIFYLVFIQLYTYAQDIEESAGFFATALDISTIILFGVIAIIAVPILMRIKHIGIKNNRPLWIIVGYIIVTAAVFGLVLGIFSLADRGVPGWLWLHDILNQKVVLFGSMWVWAAVFAVLGAVFWLKRHIRKKALNNILD